MGDLRVAIEHLAKEHRSSARGLQSDILTSTADQLERLLDDKGLMQYLRVYGLK